MSVFTFTVYFGNENTILFTDKSTSLVDLAGCIELHVTDKSSKELTEDALKWIPIFIRNALGKLLGNYHNVKAKYLKRYLNGFV